MLELPCPCGRVVSPRVACSDIFFVQGVSRRACTSRPSVPCTVPSDERTVWSLTILPTPLRKDGVIRCVHCCAVCNFLIHISHIAHVCHVCFSVQVQAHRAVSAASDGPRVVAEIAMLTVTASPVGGLTGNGFVSGRGRGSDTRWWVVEVEHGRASAASYFPSCPHDGGGLIWSSFGVGAEQRCHGGVSPVQTMAGFHIHFHSTIWYGVCVCARVFVCVCEAAAGLQEPDVPVVPIQSARNSTTRRGGGGEACRSLLERSRRRQAGRRAVGWRRRSGSVKAARAAVLCGS
jgi:hypothetical protein